METVHAVVEIVSLAISVVGALIVIWGVGEAVIGFISIKYSREKKDQISANEALRQRLGAHLLLGLEIFIAADIISSVVSPSWQKVGILGAIVGIRTVLSYFLRMEVRQTARENR